MDNYSKATSPVVHQGSAFDSACGFYAILNWSKVFYLYLEIF